MDELAIYQAALERPPEERSEFLREACGGDEPLRLRVEARLCHRSGGAYDSPTVAAAPTVVETPVEGAGSQIGHYKLLQQIGEGGMGVVFMAEQSQPVKRRVALKIIKPGMDSRQVIARFEAERQALALMDHVSIAKVFDAGTTATGRPYFVMELVKGVPITEYCDEHQLTPRERLEVFVGVCRAVQHAHQKGIIHRDLKPTNVLVADYDQRPVSKVIDFGVAKATSPVLTEKTLFTQFGQVVGTLEYMSPEQAKLNQLDIDTRSDIYSLGVLLYELLTGTTPFDRRRLRSAAWDEMLRMIREDEPPKPSTRLSDSAEALPSIAARRRMEPSKLTRLLRGELDWIVMKALEKNRSQRFASALDLADELQRYLADQPIRSRPISSWQRGWRICRRFPIVSGLLAALAIALSAGFMTTIWQWRNAQRNALEADAARAMADQSQQQTQAALHESERRLSRVYTERGLQSLEVDPHAGLPWLVKALRTEPTDSAAHELHRLRIALMLRELPALIGVWPAAADAEFRADGTQVAIAVGKDVLLITLPNMLPAKTLSHDRPVVSVDFAAAGDRLATVAWKDGSAPLLRIWDTASGQAESGELDLSEREYNMQETPTIHFTPDGERFVATYAGMYNRWHSKLVVRVFDSRTFKQVAPTFAHHSDLDYLSGYHRLSPDRLRVLVPRGVPASDARVAWVDPEFPDDMYRPQQYDLLTAQAVHPPLEHPLDFYGMPVYSGDGTRIATSAAGVVRVWDAANGHLIRDFSLSTPQSDARTWFHPDGQQLLAVEGHKACLWDIASGELKHEWAHEDKFWLDPTGRYRVWRDPNGVDYIADSTREEPAAVSLPDLSRVQFSPDGSRFVLDPAGHDAAGMYISPPERILASADAHQISPPWRFSTRDIPQPFSFDGRFFLSKQEAGIWLWDLNRRRLLVQTFPPRRSQAVRDAAVSADRRTISLLTDDGTLSSWDAATGRSLHEPFVVPPPSVSDAGSRWHHMTLNRHANKVAIVGEFRDPTADNESRDVQLVQVWNSLAGRREFPPLVFHQESSSWISSLQFVLDDTRLMVVEYVHAPQVDRDNAVTRSSLTRLHLFDAQTGAAARPAQDFPHTLRVLDVTQRGDRCLVLREQDTWMASGQQGEAEPAFVQLVDTATWEPCTPHMIPAVGVARNAKLSPDGSRVVLGQGEIWDVQTGQRLATAAITHRDVEEFVFQDDGQAFLAVTQGGDSHWEPTSEMRLIALNGVSLSPPMINTRTGRAHVAIHPRGTIVAAAGSGLRLWDASGGAPLSRAIDLDSPGSAGRVENYDRAIFFTPTGNRLYIEAGDQLLLVPWEELMATMPSDEVLAAWSGILSGHRIDDAGGIVPLSAGDYQQAWNVVQAATTTLPAAQD